MEIYLWLIFLFAPSANFFGNKTLEKNKSYFYYFMMYFITLAIMPLLVVTLFVLNFLIKEDIIGMVNKEQEKTKEKEKKPVNPGEN
jgi:hypothetical protein